MLSKHRFVLWLTTYLRVLTKGRMRGDMGIPIDNVDCVLCDHQSLDDTQYLLCTCEWNYTKEGDI